MTPVITTAEFITAFSSGTLILVDANGGRDAKTNYTTRHLDHALFVDVNTQLADIKPDVSQGGRHPLPTPEQFSKVLASLGITAESHVVVYDDLQGSNAAARFWWMLKAAGHDKVQVLDGGFQEAVRLGFPVRSGEEYATPARPYKVEKWNLPLADMQEVERVSKDKAYRVIDVRSHERYDGLTEPIDLIAGHIPGAINVPFTSNLDDKGLFLSPAALKARYEKILEGVKPENVIVHCGSGVTACHTLLAIAHAGLEMPRLYVGSWSEWSRCNKPMVTKDTGSVK